MTRLQNESELRRLELYRHRGLLYLRALHRPLQVRNVMDFIQAHPTATAFYVGLIVGFILCLISIALIYDPFESSPN